MQKDKLAQILTQMKDPDLNFSRYITQVPPKIKSQSGVSGLTSIEEAKQNLEKNPYDKKALTKMADFFAGKDLDRLAAYFHGRLKLAKE